MRSGRRAQGKQESAHGAVQMECAITGTARSESQTNRQARHLFCLVDVVAVHPIQAAPGRKQPAELHRQVNRAVCALARDSPGFNRTDESFIMKSGRPPLRVRLGGICRLNSSAGSLCGGSGKGKAPIRGWSQPTLSRVSSSFPAARFLKDRRRLVRCNSHKTQLSQSDRSHLRQLICLLGQLLFGAVARKRLPPAQCYLRNPNDTVRDGR